MCDHPNHDDFSVCGVCDIPSIEMDESVSSLSNTGNTTYNNNPNDFISRNPSECVAVAAAEIQLEVTHPWLLKTILFWWYAVLLLGFLLLVFNWEAQWKCTNLCGGMCELSTSDWDSSACLATRTNESMSWTGNISAVTQSPLSRFPHFFWNIPHPAPNTTQLFPLKFNIKVQGRWVKNYTEEEASLPYSFSMNITRYLLCRSGQSQCDLLTLDADISNSGSDFDSDIVFTVFDPPRRMLEAHVMHKSSIGVVFQKNAYTIGSIVVRYLCVVISMCVLAHYCKQLGGVRKYRKWMTEQIWVGLVQLAFILYANPLHAWCVYSTKTDGTRDFLRFIEFHLSQEFRYIVMAFMVLLVRCLRHAPGPLPKRTHVLIVFSWMVTIILDLCVVAFYNGDWTITASSYTMISTSSADDGVVVVMALQFAVQALWLIIGVLTSLKLYYSLSRLPYLETRARQLSFRLFVFVLTWYLVYALAQFAFFLAVPYKMSLLSFHRDQQIGEVLIAFTFVNIVAYAYAPTHREDRKAPPHPHDGRWKRIAWPESWFEWIHLHGGTMYFFTTEHERDNFEAIQATFARQQNLPRRHKFRIRRDSFLQDAANAVPHLLERGYDGMTSVGHFVSFVAGFRPDVLKTRDHGFFCLETAIDCFNLSWEVYNEPTDDIPLSPNCRIVSSDTPTTPNVSFSGLDVPLAKEEITPSPSPPPDDTPLTTPINLDQFGFNLVKMMEYNGVQAFVCIRDETIARYAGEYTIAIAFRGTSNVANVKTDIDCKRVTWSGMVSRTMESAERASRFLCFDILRTPLVHNGMSQIWEAFNSDIMDTMRDLMRHRIASHVLVTGHSLGGGIAQLCAYALKTTLEIHPRVYTFGSPRLGNDRFRQLYDEAVPSTYRIVNEHDIVTRVSVYLDNPHVGVEVSIDHHGNIVSHPTFIERMLRPGHKSIGLKNHLLEQYKRSLDAIADRTGFSRRCLEVVYTQPDDE
eukprot:PhM_4_TR14821/c0_g1_i1/m.93978